MNEWLYSLLALGVEESDVPNRSGGLEQMRTIRC